jgi:hypothetical protein
MEVRSSERVRTPVTRMARSTPSANENARALISMMARSTTCCQISLAANLLVQIVRCDRLAHQIGDRESDVILVVI